MVLQERICFNSEEGYNMDECHLTVLLHVNGKSFHRSMAVDSFTDEPQMTDEKFEQCYMYLFPGVREVMRDENKIVSSENTTT